MTGGFFAILDDISTLLNKTTVMSKVAVKKTSAILGDDLAVNAEKAKGFSSSRELPVIWKITKGSFINKLIILPIIFLLNYFFPSLITPILILGGIYLSYEGAEKIMEWLLSVNHSKRDKELSEEDKIKSAIITDFILSLEIVVLALSIVKEEEFFIQLFVTTFVSFVATIGVYGIVALIVRCDDFGLFILEKSVEYKYANNKIETLSKDDIVDNLPKLYSKSIIKFYHYSGRFFISLMPKIIFILTIVGTIAMLLVAGGIFTHNIEVLHHFIEHNHLIDYITPINILLSLNIGILLMLVKKLVDIVIDFYKEKVSN